MFMSDASRPIARKIAFERLRFSDTFKRGSGRLVYELIDSLNQLPVLLLEPEIITPGRMSEDYSHASASSFS
jgi:hypothetical protein